MSHPEFEARMQEVLDERRSPGSDPFLRHMASEDPACRARLADYEALLAGVARLTSPAVSADFTSRVLMAVAVPEATAVSSAPATRSWESSLKYFVAIGSAIAAAVVVALALHGPPRDPVAGPAHGGSGDIATAAPALGHLAQQAKDRYAGLAQETRLSVVGAMSVIPRLPVADDRPPATTDQPARDTPTAWVRDVVEGVKPVGESTVGAVSSLLMAFPMGDDKRS